MTGDERKQAVLDLVLDDNPDAVLFDGLEDAIIGVARQHSKDLLIVYDERKIIDHLMDSEEMTEEEAWDWYGFNIQCLWAGEGTPLIMRSVEP